MDRQPGRSSGIGPGLVMRIGLAIGLHGNQTEEPAPRWEQIRDQVIAAEVAGFDIVVFEDGMYFEGNGLWESMAMGGAIATATSTIGISHSVVNIPIRPAALIAKAAETLDEISGGRYTLGIGAGNTPEDYEAFDIDADPRYSRFAESFKVIYGLLRDGHIDFEGKFHTARDTSLYPRGPTPNGPPIVIAASGPKMLQLCALHADGWNWWGAATGRSDHLDEIILELERACEKAGRDSKSLQRTLDIYSIDILGVLGDQKPEHVLTGSTSEIVERILALTEFGIDEVRVDLTGPPDTRAEAAAAMTEIVELIHSG